jgi:hypothetical protein
MYTIALLYASNLKNLDRKRAAKQAFSICMQTCFTIPLRLHANAFHASHSVCMQTRFMQCKAFACKHVSCVLMQTPFRTFSRFMSKRRKHVSSFAVKTAKRVSDAQNRLYSKRAKTGSMFPVQTHLAPFWAFWIQTVCRFKSKPLLNEVNVTWCTCVHRMLWRCGQQHKFVHL